MAIPESPDFAYSPLPPGVRLGDVIGGRYRLDGILGAGGMGVVVGALHQQLDQRIAIKFMAPLLMGDREGLRRFMLEAKHAARISGEHVVRVFDVASLDDGTPYIVMEYLEGEDLRALLARRGPLPVAEVVDCVLQAGEAIAEAHLAGIVHRDLKPGNLFLAARADGSPLVKVLDFGVSKLLRRTPVMTGQGASTGPHAIMGSPLYAAPEQLRAPAEVDARADVWALGAILYELLSGKTPFTGDTFLEICTNVVNAPLPPLRPARSDVPSGLEAVVSRALAKRPAARYQTVGELAAALSPFAPRRALVSVERIENLFRGGPQSSSPGAGPPSPPCDKTLPSQPDPRTVLSPARRRKGMRARSTVALAAYAFAALLAPTALWTVGRWLRSPSPRAAEHAKASPIARPSLEASWAAAEPAPSGSPREAPADVASRAALSPTGVPAPAGGGAEPVPSQAVPPVPSQVMSPARSPVSPQTAQQAAPPPVPRGSAARPAPSARRAPDTSGFGGLQ